jgi:uncharacterized protein YjiS (DUF1127 family)
MFELQEFADERRVITGLRSGFERVFAAVRQWYVRRQTVARLAKLSAHQLRDIGVEPADVYDAVNNHYSALWEKVHLRPDSR